MGGPGSLLLVVALGAATQGDGANAGWSEVVEWVRSNGGFVHDGFKENLTLHGGASVRGIVSNQALGAETTILEVPYKLWFTLDSFPEILNSDVEGCTQLRRFPAEADRMKLAAAIAVETKKGSASFHSPQLSLFPTLEDFRTFHPRLMGSALHADFAALPVTSISAQLQAMDQVVHDCFQRWERAPKSPVAGIHWDDVMAGRLNILTRSHNVTGTSALPVLIPAADMMNTDKASLLNTVWGETSNNISHPLYGPISELPGMEMLKGERKFTISTGKDGVGAGQELYESYCPHCDNSRMLLNWGVYLEANTNPLPQDPRVECAAKASSTTTGKSLREAAEHALDLGSLPTAQAAGWTAPRCRPEVLADPDQGPLRCALARLAWEHCAGAWGREAPKAARLNLKPTPALTAEGLVASLGAQEAAVLEHRDAYHSTFVSGSLPRRGLRRTLARQ